MRISKYTFLFDIEHKEYYTYSTLSNALIEIDADSYRAMKQSKQANSDIVAESFDSELYETLVQKKFITNNDIDNFLFYKSIIESQRADRYHMHMTLAPTMDCCFNCHYCFEKFKDKSYMSEEVMDGIIKYLNQIDTKPILRLTWFGGEPLMALPQIEKLYDKLSAGYQKPEHSDIITTGFHITPAAIKIMQRVGIESMQITLDGLKDTHNKIKFTEGCDDVFDKIMDNAELLLKSSEIHLCFRVNLTKSNASEFVDLYKYIVDRFRPYHHKLGISPAFVTNRGDCNMASSDVKTFFTNDEETRFTLDLKNTHGIATQYLRYPSRFFNECAIRNVLSIAFDPEGYAYKCWEVIGNKNHAFGHLNTDGTLGDINEIIINRHLFGADPIEDPVCSECKYLPICNGGCPIQRIQNVFECRKNCTCTHFKGHLVDILKIHLELTKAGLDNH